MEPQHVSLRIITYNVASTYPEEDVKELLGIRPPFDVEDTPHIYAIGLQEVSVRLSNLMHQVVFEDPWITQLRCELKTLGYVKLISSKLQGLLLIIFVKRNDLLHFRDISVSYVRTGLGGMWGNKGATIVTLKAFGRSMCFVNSHLAAHEHGYYRRLQEYKEIVERAMSSGQTCNINAHDYSFWFGDLNFRLNDVTTEQLEEAIRNDTVLSMLQFDQLARAQRSGEAFEDFEEEEIQFRPTFKFQAGTGNYNFNSRKPGWTDRILYRCSRSRSNSDKLELTAQNYRSHENYHQSDHKPVSALFAAKIFPETILLQDRVYFYRCDDWTVNRGFQFWFCCDRSVTPRRTDWIALLHEDFTAIDRYIAYVWADSQSVQRSPIDDGDENFPSNRRIYHQIFSDQLLILPGTYVLIYFRGIRDVLGISQPFKILDCAVP